MLRSNIITTTTFTTTKINDLYVFCSIFKVLHTRLSQEQFVFFVLSTRWSSLSLTRAHHYIYLKYATGWGWEHRSYKHRNARGPNIDDHIWVLKKKWVSCWSLSLNPAVEQYKEKRLSFKHSSKITHLSSSHVSEMFYSPGGIPASLQGSGHLGSCFIFLVKDKEAVTSLFLPARLSRGKCRNLRIRRFCPNQE